MPYALGCYAHTTARILDASGRSALRGAPKLRLFDITIVDPDWEHCPVTRCALFVPALLGGPQVVVFTIAIFALWVLPLFRVLINVRTPSAHPSE